MTAAAPQEQRHQFASEADNCLKAADITGVGVFARQASEFAPDVDKEDDTVIVVLRGDAARAGRKALVEVADLIRETIR